MAAAGTKGRVSAWIQNGSRRGAGTATPGTAPHSLFVLVVLEVLALVWIRRQFRSAHGG